MTKLADVRVDEFQGRVLMVERKTLVIELSGSTVSIQRFYRAEVAICVQKSWYCFLSY